jgi:hypothetical protein
VSSAALSARVSVSVAVIAALVGSRPGAARAERDKFDKADGPTACRALDAKNNKERREYEKEQPAEPYKYPQPRNVLDAPWGEFFAGIGGSYDVLLATLIPHAGAQLRGAAPASVASWPWALSFGPPYTCSRREGTYDMRFFRVHRLLVEPGVVAGDRGIGFFTRPGYRFVYHPSDWVLGVGGGFGTTVEIAGNREPFRASLSPEAVLQFGNCCDHAYFTLAIRYDHYFTGRNNDIVGASLGFVYF